MNVTVTAPLLLLAGVVGVAVPTLLVRSENAAPAASAPATGSATGTGTVSGAKTPGAKDKDEKKNFTITGSVTAVTPGTSKSLTITITNPNGYAIDVTSITTSVGAPNPSCPGAALNVAPYVWTSGPAVTAPGKGSTTMNLTAHYVDSLTTDTSTCNAVTFPLTFAGTAEKATKK